MKFLERLLDPDQLICYPSPYRRFNEVYEKALDCLSSHPEMELYIVQFRDRNDDLHFSFVPAVMVDVVEPSSFGLKDICGVLRR